MSDRDHTTPGEAANDVAPERLAALLDGKLTEQEREEILKRLGRSPEDVALLANAVAAIREIEGEPSADRKTPARVGEPAPPAWQRRKRASRAWVVTVATLLVVAGVAGGAWFAARRTGAGALGPAHYVAMLDQSAARLPAGWNGHPWSTTRGDQDVPVSPRARAVRLGARLVDLQVAVRTSDSTRSIIAADVARLVAGLPASAAISERYVTIGNRSDGWSPSLQKELDESANAVRMAAGEHDVDLGSWLEAARLAAVRHDAAYFRQSADDRVLDGFTGSETTPESRAAVERVRSAVASPSPAWASLTDDLMSLLRAAAAGL